MMPPEPSTVSSAPEGRRRSRGLLVEFVLLMLPYVLVALAVVGVVTGQRWLAGGARALLIVLFAAAALYGIMLAVFLPFHVVRRWRAASVSERVILAATATFAVLGLGGILAAWIVTRR